MWILFHARRFSLVDRAAWVAALAIVLLSGCSGESGPAVMPSAAASQPEEKPPSADLTFVAQHLGWKSSEAGSRDFPTRLKSLCESNGGTLKRLKGREVPAALDAKSSLFPVLTDGDGRVALVLGRVNFGGTRYLTAVRDDAVPLLLNAESLANDGESVWCLGGGGGARIEAAGTAVVVDPPWRSLPGLKPFTEGRTTFTITNAGPGDALLGQPSTSCGCTVVDGWKPGVLPTGQSRTLTVTLKTNAAPAIRQTVRLPLLDEAGKVVQAIQLPVYAWQQASMTVVPDSLDFGAIYRDSEPATRELYLREVETDRFEITNVSYDGLPLRHSVSERAEPGGLASYAVQLTLDAQSLPPGEIRGELLVTTTSKLRPTVRVPVRFDVKPRVQAFPSTLTFGGDETGASSERMTRLVALSGEPFRVSLAREPERFQAVFTEGEASIDLLVRPLADGIGDVRETLELLIEDEGWTERLSIPCVALTTAERSAADSGSSEFEEKRDDEGP